MARILAIKLASIRLLLPVGRARNVGHWHAVVDRLAAENFSLRLLLGRVEHLEHDVARNEADAGVVGHHEVARRDPNLADLHRAVDLHGFDPPLAGDRGDVARPHRVVERAGMGDVAHAALNDRADLALAFAGLAEMPPMFETSATPWITSTSPCCARLCASNSAMRLTCWRAPSIGLM